MSDHHHEAECNEKKEFITVDVIIPVHNASETIEETVQSAMYQVIPDHLSRSILRNFSIAINVCCYDDGSTDGSWHLLNKLLQEQYPNSNDIITSCESNTRSGHTTGENVIPAKLLIGKGAGRTGRGAGFARNRAAEMSIQNQDEQITENFLCLLDSDDTMHSHRVAEQLHGMMSLPPEERRRTLMGCKVERYPPGSTWHYTQWANGLTDERLHLERFREVTVLQPTWMISRSRFVALGGYIEAPTHQDNGDPRSVDAASDFEGIETQHTMKLIHPNFDCPETLRLAEDLRFYHCHLFHEGLLKLHRPSQDPTVALVTYRHRHNQSQSYQTSRKLLVHLRALAFEKCVLQKNNANCGIHSWTKYDGAFVVWGAGRDGKDFVRALSAESRKRIHCFVDVDEKKIKQGFYVNKDMGLRVPIVHFSLLAKDPATRRHLLEDESKFGVIDKSSPSDVSPKQKRPRLECGALSATPQAVKAVVLDLLPKLPVVVCVAMYRTNGALETNVRAIQRTEGKDLWHFS